VRFGGTERNAAGDSTPFSWRGSVSRAKMPRANAKASKKSASAEEQELLRLRKELMEKQAKLKRVLAQEKRQGSGVLQAVREPPVVVLSRAERDRDAAFGMSWFLTPELTSRHPSDAFPTDTGPRREGWPARTKPGVRAIARAAFRALELLATRAAPRSPAGGD